MHEEDGCELYALHQAADRLVMIEKWASPEALRTHSKGAALAALNPRLAGQDHRARRSRRAAAGAAGDPGQGQL